MFWSNLINKIMNKQVQPKLIAINQDDHHAKHIGVTGDGYQFFMTNPFEPADLDKAGCEYIALFVFDRSGTLKKSEIETLGPRGSFSKDAANNHYFVMLDSLGEVSYQRIEVKPFSVIHNGVAFGLIVRKPEDDEEEGYYAVEMHPGNYMAFFEPWDCGDYDT